MISVTLRGDKALLVTGISFFGGCLGLFWLLFLLLPGAEKPWGIWLLAGLISLGMVFLIGLLIALLVGCYCEISENAICNVAFGKRRLILKKEILLIADIPLGKGDRFYVVYPKGYDESELRAHTHISIGEVERTKMIQRDKRLLIIRKTKKTTQAFQRFGYASMITLK